MIVELLLVVRVLKIVEVLLVVRMVKIVEVLLVVRGKDSGGTTGC
jgi:hypothetical protein